MKLKPLSYGRQTIEEDDVAAVVETLRSDYLTQGPKVTEFEAALCARFGARHACVAVNATAALHLAGMALGWRKGDLVLTASITFLASANCAVYCGADVGFVDIDPVTYTIDCAKLEEKLERMESAGRRVKAVVAIDYAGHPCDWPRLRALADKHGFQLVDDACHAPGARIGGVEICSARFADAVILSFHPVKHFTTGEGGALLTNSEKINEAAQRFRSHAMARKASEMTANDGPWYYEMREPGFNYRLPDILCALGISQLKKLDRFLAARREIAAFYDRAFGDDKRFIVPRVASGAEHAYHLYPLQIRFDEAWVSKKDFFARMREQGIILQVHYVPVHTQPYYRERFFAAYGELAETELFYAREVSIPLYPALEASDLERVVQSVRWSMETPGK